MKNYMSTTAIKMQRTLNNKPNNYSKSYKVSSSKIVIRYDELYHLLSSLLDTEKALRGKNLTFNKKTKN